MNNELRNALTVIANHETIAPCLPLVRKAIAAWEAAGLGSVNADKEEAWEKELMKRIGIRVYNLIDAMMEEDEDAE